MSDTHDHAEPETGNALASQLQPNSRMCFGCGLENASGLRIRFYNDGPNAARAEVILGDMHQGYPGIAHGGVIATMLDEAMGRAPLAGDSMRLMFTARMEVRYRRPVPLHTPITVRGWIDKDRGRLLDALAEVVLPDGTVAAEASGTLAAIPEEQLRGMDTPEAGWQVYPLD